MARYNWRDYDQLVVIVSVCGIRVIIRSGGKQITLQQATAAYLNLSNIQLLLFYAVQTAKNCFRLQLRAKTLTAAADTTAA